MAGRRAVGSRAGRRGSLLAGTIALLCLALAGSAQAVSLEPVGITYAQPVFVTSDPGNRNRLFVVEKAGTIQLTRPSVTSTFLDQAAITSSDGERGLLSMAFAPDFATSHRFYVVYSIEAPAGTAALGDDGDLQLDELVANGDVADEGSRRHVLTIEHSSRSNHNGGQLQFAPDGYLYWSTGDGGGANRVNAQDTGSLLGKILRIDPEDPDGAGPADYTVPADNPFVGVAGAQDEIWSYGFRNPWRFSFDRLTGALAIGDVGQASWEEVDYEPPSAGGGRGDDFGWDCYEGTHPFALGTDPGCAGQTFTDPVFEYSSGADNPPNCAITGGYVVRDAGIPELAGRYLYADLCEGVVRSILPGVPASDDPRSEGLNVTQPTSFGEDACGRVYVASLGGQVSRIVGDSPTDCVPPQTTIDAGPSGPTNDPTPTFTFHSNEANSNFECRVDDLAFSPCASPRTLSPLDDGWHRFRVRAVDGSGNVDPTPASRSFAVRTADVRVAAGTLTVIAAPGVTDNLAITRPTPSTVRVTDRPGGQYAGSGVHAGPGCIRRSDHAADCDAAAISDLRALSRDRMDRVVNKTSLPSTLNGGAARDVLVGGSRSDVILGGSQPDSMRGMNGNDALLAADSSSDTLVNCDGGTVPGRADRARLDPLPADRASVVRGCEITRR